MQVAVEIDEYRDNLKIRRRGRLLAGVGKVAINLAGSSAKAKKSTSVKTHELATALEEELTDYSGKLALIKEETKVLTEEELHQQKIDVYAEDERHQVCGEHGYDISPVGLLRPDIAASSRLVKQVQTFPKCVACKRLGANFVWTRARQIAMQNMLHLYPELRPEQADMWEALELGQAVCDYAGCVLVHAAKINVAKDGSAPELLDLGCCVALPYMASLRSKLPEVVLTLNPDTKRFDSTSLEHITQSEREQIATIVGIPFGAASAMEKRRQIKCVVILNPVSGSGNAAAIWSSVSGFVDQMADAVQFEIIETQHAGHAWEIAHESDLLSMDCFLFVGGNSLIHEFVNGLLSRQDLPAMEKLPWIGVLPAGSGNQIAKSLTELAGLPCEPWACMFLATRGHHGGYTSVMDLQRVDRGIRQTMVAARCFREDNSKDLCVW